MKKKTEVFLLIAILGGLASCSLPVSQEGLENVSYRYSTVSALLTKTALSTPAPAGTPEAALVFEAAPPDATPALFSAVEARPGEHSPQAPSADTFDKPCDAAQPGRPIDITVPDDTRFYPGEYFSKTWRLVNAGSCVWTSDYAVVWFSGDNLGITQAQFLMADVEPGRAVEVTLDMVAPLRPGTYQSNWKLRNAQGELFGIGPNGSSPFWARIIVIPIDTQTATPTFLAATPTPLIYASGALVLRAGESADLDSGQLVSAEAGDLGITQMDEKLILTPYHDTRIGHFGQNAPGMLDCSSASLSAAPVDLAEILPGSYLCYRTTQGLPGRLFLAGVDLEQSTVDLEFVTWVVP